MQYIQKRGCSVSLFEHIHAFCLSFKLPELRNISFSNLIFNFELYYTCEPALQKKLLSAITNFFETELDEVSLAEQKHRVFYLFYCLSTFYPIDHALKLFFEDQTQSPNKYIEENKSSENLSSNSFIPSLASFNFMDVTLRNNSSNKSLSRRNTAELEENVTAKYLNNLKNLIEIRESIIKLIQRFFIY